MAKEAFVEIAFRRKTVVLIEQANKIIAEMQQQGFTLTVRQLYYQFVARGLLENRQQNYQRLASVVDDARKAGLIDWNAIEDRTRYLRSYRTFANPTEALFAAARNYMEDLWADQDAYVEVWIEKDALLGVIEPACGEFRIPYFACRGYASSSELYTAGKRLRRMEAKGKRPLIFHLGDHDPSGLDMTRVNEDSVGLFGRTYGIEVRRLALNMDQVEQYDPPPNPAKESDSRFAEYAAQHGDESWELDALSPSVIDALIRDEIATVIDQDKFDAAREREGENEALIRSVAEEWRNVSRYMKHREDTVFLPDLTTDEVTADDILFEAAKGTDDEED